MLNTKSSKLKPYNEIIQRSLTGFILNWLYEVFFGVIGPAYNQ